MKKNYALTFRACYLSGFNQAIVCNFSAVLFVIFKTAFGVNFEMLGRLVLINFITQLTVDIIFVKLVDKIGYKASALLSQGFVAAGFILMGILPTVISPYAGLVISTIVFSIGGAIIEVVMSPVVESLPSDNKASSMAFLHSFFCWGQIVVILLTSLLIKLFGSSIWQFACFMWATLPVICFFMFIKAPMAPPLPSNGGFSLKALGNIRFFLVALLAMLCGGAAEQTIAQWASLFAERGLMVSKLTGDLLGPCLFALFMLLGRLTLAKYSEKFRLSSVLMFSSYLAVFFYLVTVFAPHPFISLLGCALCGFAVSNLWPGTLSLCAKNIKNGGAPMFGALAVFGDLGCSLGSYIPGIISDSVLNNEVLIGFANKIGMDITSFSLRAGILVAVIFPLLMIVGLWVLRGFENKTEKNQITP